MGILAIQYQTLDDAPLLVAFNREERYARQSLPVKIQSGRPRVVCGVDRKSGGTWGGVNQHGMFVAAINAPKRLLPYDPRSRGLLCKELLSCATPEEAVERAQSELKSGKYAGVNFLCVDRRIGFVVYGGMDDAPVEELKPGLHMLSANPLDDSEDQRQEYVRRSLTLHRIDSAVTFFAAASVAFSRKPDAAGKHGVVVLEPGYGTVSSMMVSLTERSQKSVMQFANGVPGDVPYEDASALLRQVLSTDRASQKKKARAEAKDEAGDENLDSDI